MLEVASNNPVASLIPVVEEIVQTLRSASLVMNFDQTPLKHAQVSSQTLEKRGSKHALITSSAQSNSSMVEKLSKVCQKNLF